MKLLSLKNRQKNQEYIKKNGIGRFIRYVRNSQLKDGDQDYEDWLKDHVAFRKELKRQRKCCFFLFTADQYCDGGDGYR